MNAMNRIGVILAMLVLLIAARSVTFVTLQAGDSAHCAGDVLVQTGPLDVDCVAFTPTPTATALATDTPTFTPTATSTATDTPTATATSTLAPTVTATFTPLPTDTPTSTATATATLAATNTPLPRSQWPLCPSHDDTQWHALDDASRQCHYDHEHGDDPNDPAIAAIFGPSGAWTAGQTISYPWATSAHENHMKHGGYKVYAGFRACSLTQAYNGMSPVNCIKAFRIETHNIGQQIDVYARYHSYFAEFQICKYPAYTECGVMRVGGWMDFGILISPYISHRVVRPAMDIDFGPGSLYGAGGVQMLMHFDADTPELDQITLADNAAYSTLTPDTPHNRYVIATYPPALDGSGSQSSWSGPNIPSRYTFSHNPFLRYKVDILDAWNLLDASILTTPQFICRDGSCAFNGSIRGASELSAHVISTFDPDADGFADYSGFSDRFGNVVQGCGGVSLDCVPFSMAHVPTGYAAWNPGGCECGVGIDKEYDTSPSGKHWIQFPN